MNKKGLFIPLTAVLTLIIFSYAYMILIVNAEASTYQNVAGARALAIREADQGLNQRIVYIEEAARISVYDALTEFALNGGGCEDWTKCNPKDNLKTNFLKYFEKEFYKTLKELNILNDIYTFDLEIRKDNFDLIGKSQKELLEAKRNVDYKRKHEFKLNFNYDFGIYEQLYGKYHESRSDCPSKSDLSADKLECNVLSKENYIKFERTQQLLFTNPILIFKVGLIKPL